MRTNSHKLETHQPLAWLSRSSVRLGRHFVLSLKQLWRSYRKKLKRCQKDFSETAVHELRVETRRLLAKLELCDTVTPEINLKKIRRKLKNLFDELDELRDTQVQMLYVDSLLKGIPGAKDFYDFLQCREQKFLKPTSRAVRKIKTDKLAKCLRQLKSKLERVFSQPATSRRCLKTIENTVQRAFHTALKLRYSMIPADTQTIHRARIAFKHFRYMVEALHPLLKGVGKKQLQAMHQYQTRMGEIQDLEVLSAGLERAAAKRKLATAALGPLRHTLLKERAHRIQAYLKSADQIHQFRPPATE